MKKLTIKIREKYFGSIEYDTSVPTYNVNLTDKEQKQFDNTKDMKLYLNNNGVFLSELDLF